MLDDAQQKRSLYFERLSIQTRRKVPGVGQRCLPIRGDVQGEARGMCVESSVKALIQRIKNEKRIRIR
jgi:hypothetical protein